MFLCDVSPKIHPRMDGGRWLVEEEWGPSQAEDAYERK